MHVHFQHLRHARGTLPLLESAHAAHLSCPLLFRIWLSGEGAATHYRRLAFSCGACTHELIINSLYVVKYTMDESAGALTVDGVPDEAGACVATGKCDFGMLWGPNVWAGYRTIMYPYALTLPYFGKASRSLSESSTFETLGGTPLAYDEPTMRHELYIEPLTGKVVKYNMPFMFNIVGFDRTTFDGPLFANVFNSSTFPIVFPLHVESNRLTAGAAALNAIASAPAMAYLAMYLCTLVHGPPIAREPCLGGLRRNDSHALASPGQGNVRSR